MSEFTNQKPTIQPMCNQQERLELANQLYREFHPRCFWHSPRDLLITEDLILLVVKGLRTYGGRRGFLLAGKLLPTQAEREPHDHTVQPPGRHPDRFTR